MKTLPSELASAHLERCLGRTEGPPDIAAQVHSARPLGRVTPPATHLLEHGGALVAELERLVEGERHAALGANLAGRRNGGERATQPGVRLQGDARLGAIERDADLVGPER